MSAFTLTFTLLLAFVFVSCGGGTEVSLDRTPNRERTNTKPQSQFDPQFLSQYQGSYISDEKGYLSISRSQLFERNWILSVGEARIACEFLITGMASAYFYKEETRPQALKNVSHTLVLQQTDISLALTANASVMEKKICGQKLAQLKGGSSSETYYVETKAPKALVLLKADSSGQFVRKIFWLQL